MHRRKLQLILSELERRRPQSITWTWIDIDGSRHDREIPFDPQLHKDFKPGEELIMDMREVTARLVSDSSHEWGWGVGNLWSFPNEDHALATRRNLRN